MTFIGLLTVISISGIFILHNTFLSFFGIKDREKEILPLVKEDSFKKVKNLKWIYILTRVATTLVAFALTTIVALLAVKLGVGETTTRFVFMVALLTSFFLYIEMMITSAVGQRVTDSLLKDLHLKGQ